MIKQMLLIRVEWLFTLIFFCVFTPWLHAQTVVTDKQPKYVIEDTEKRLRVEYEGKITLDPDNRGIRAISDGGFLRIEKNTFGNSRELLINSSGNNLAYEYKEGGRVKPFKPDGKAWLSDILPELASSTSIAAESRVDQLYEKGGVKEVVNALPELKNDQIRAAYIIFLLKKNIKEADIPNIIHAVGNTIKSDHYRYHTLKQIFPEHSSNSAHILKAVEQLNSDHFKYLFFKPLLVNQTSTSQQQLAFQLINTLKNDHLKTQLFKNSKFDNLPDESFRALLKDAITAIVSDYNRNEALKSLSKNTLSEDKLVILIDNVQYLRNEHFKADFLKNLCKARSGEKVKTKIWQEAKSLKSSYFYGEVVRCLD